MTKILHNRIRWLLAMAAVLLTSGGMSAATETVTRLYDSTLLTKTVRTDDGVQYTHLSWLGLDATRMPGAPEMPVEYIRFIVPVYTNNFRVTVTAGGLSRQTLAAPVFPSQEPVLASYEGPVEFTVPDPQYYSATQPIRAEYVEDGFVDGCNHIVTVAVYPASYDDASLSVTTASTVNVTLEYDSCTAAELESTPIFPPRASKYLDLKSMVVNGERTANRQYAPREKASPDAPEYYYIITPKNLEEAFQDLAIWKRQKGYNVIVKCIEDICADSRYEIGATYYWDNKTPQEVLDSAMSLRCYLKDEFQEHGHFFCLLAGDWRTSMPIRRVYQSRTSSNYNKIPSGANYIPTDTYFTDLTSLWKLDNDLNSSIYSAPYYNLTFTPTITLSRLLCYDKRQVTNYINKLIIYEGNPGLGNNAYLGRTLVSECCSYYWDKDKQRFVHSSGCHYGYSDTVRNQLRNMDEIKLVQDDAHFKDPNYGPPIGNSPRAVDFVKEMNEYGFIDFHTHGSPKTIQLAWGKYFVTNGDSISKFFRILKSDLFADNCVDIPGNSMLALKNRTKPNVVFSTGCENAPFDALTVQDYTLSTQDSTVYYSCTGMNIASCFTVGTQNGGVGFIGCSRAGNHSDNHLMLASIIKKLYLYPRLGMALSYAKSYYPNTYTKMITHLIGEPEFEMWLGKPHVMDINLIPNASGVEIQGNIPYVTTYVVTDVNSSSSKIYLTGNNINNPYPGEYCLSLWRTGFLPVITLFAQKGNLSEFKHYIVREAHLGDASTDNSEICTYSIVQNGNLNVRALDNISVYTGFSIENGGVAEFNCEQAVNLNGGVVRKGGKLIIHAKDVKMGAGFKVEAGGILQIIN